ncbi:hypothetical protein D3C78_973650 [compost metagenome]
MIVIDREIGCGIKRQFIELVVGTRHGYFTVQIDTRTFGREETTVETVIRPAIVKGEIICSKTIIVAGFAGSLAN